MCVFGEPSWELFGLGLSLYVNPDIHSVQVVTEVLLRM